MMFAYDFDRLNDFLRSVLQQHLAPDAWAWLQKEGAATMAGNDVNKLNIAFVAMPRKTGKTLLNISDREQEQAHSARKGLHFQGWTTERLSRVWILMQINPAERKQYIATIENLFLNAEMGEMVALYSALPVLAYPEAWRNRCAEGIRSNIGQVLEAVICHNPYPSEQLDEAAWNQLVLKAIFTEKPVLDIVGLRERRNVTLARALSDYAHERWAAHRDVNPLLWICVSPFIDADNFADIQRVFRSGNRPEVEAAALAAYESPFEPARKMVEEDEELRRRLESGELTWASVGK